MEIQSKMKSWAMWTAIAALVIYCTKQFWGVDIAEPVNEIMDLLLPILVGFGVINNPNSKNTL